MNEKVVVVALVFLLCFATALALFDGVLGQESSSVTITQVNPTTLIGSVGTPVLLQGTILTLNGTYQVFFGQTVVATGNSNVYKVAVHFNVPEIANGTYTLTLKDLTANLNATNQFQVTTAYFVAPIPMQIQERSNLVLNFTLTGGLPNTAYSSNVSVVLPSPLNTEYSKIISLGTSNQKGTANAQVTYPDITFQPAGSLTDYAGSYTVYFNQSDSLAQSTFSVGFLDSTMYHRGQTVTVKATGYQSNQAANLTVNSVSTGATLDSQSLTASADGTITTIWVVPSYAAIGNYAVRITTTQGNPKAVQDSEVLSINGYSVQVNTVNLAGEVVPQIKVQALDLATNLTSNSISGSNGVATFTLETGLQSLTATWNGVNVGQTSITVTGNGNFTLQCLLTDLKIVVQNEIGVPMPSVTLAIAYSYSPTNGGSSQTGGASGKTDLAGTYILNSTLTGISYNIEASAYNQVFNVNNNTFNSVPAQAQAQVVIICPNEALTIDIVGYSQAPISGARIELVELTNNLFYTATTSDSGTASSLVTFGTYRVRVYKNNILINETNVEAFSANEKQIRCTLYGIRVSVSVVDLLGNPISNANVTLIGPSTERFSALTKSNGTAIFTDVIGGDMQILAFAQGSPNDYQAVTLIVNQPTSVQIKLGEYIALGSFLVQANTMAAIIVILVAVVLLVILEVYRRKKK